MSKLTSWKKSLMWSVSFMLLFSLFPIQESKASCEGISIQVDRKYNCGPGLFRIRLLGAHDAKQITWDFGDGEKIAPDSIFQYLDQEGFIDVRVKIYWLDNSICDTLFQNLVEIKSEPKPVFSFSRSVLCNGPDTVAFYCHTPGASSVSWIVDGTNYFQAGNKLIHKFASSGKKGFQVVFIDSFGCKGIVEYKDAIIVLAKVNIGFHVSDSSGCAPLKVKFNPWYDLKGQKVANMHWKLTGYADPIDAAQKVEIEFANAGVYNAGLYIETDHKCFYKLEKTNYISIGDSIPLRLNKPKSFYCFNESIELEDQNPKTGGKYTWKLPRNAQWQSDSTQSNIKFRIGENGGYMVSVRYEKNGCVIRAQIEDSIIVKSVKADFVNYENFHCAPPLDVKFKSNAYSSDAGELFHFWTIYPNGNITNPIFVSSLKDPSFLFNDMGHYDVQLIVVDKESGCTDKIVKSSMVRISTIKPFIDIQPKVACLNQEILLLNGTQPSTYQGPDSFHWTIYDTDGVTILKESSSINFSFQSNKAGIFPVKLVGGNPAYCSMNATVFDTIEVVVPKLQFLNIPENVCLGTAVRFYGDASPEKAKFTHYWEVSNKDHLYSFSSKDTLIKFNFPGEYDVKYSVQIGTGCSGSSFVQKNAIGVNGISAKIALDNQSGCLPFRVNATLSNIMNYHKGVTEGKFNILWSSQPAAGVIISDSLSLTPEFVFTQKGMHIIKARLINASGCDTILKSDTIYAGVDAFFDLSDQRVCLGAEIKAQATSKLKPTSFEWIVNSSNVQMSSTSLASIFLNSPIEGNYLISLVAEKNKTCYDTMTRNFSVIEVKAAFNSIDTLLTCAPVYAQFLSHSKNADQLLWHYGDGQSHITSLPSSGHIYIPNSGWSKGFDVSLIAINNEGCSDTLINENYVWVLGPAPDVTLTDYQGCATVKVKIQNNSRDVSRYIFDYGDTKIWDSTLAPDEHVYRFTQVMGDTQRYEMRVFTYDSVGCMAIFEPKEMIEVYRSPQAVNKINSTNTCNNKEVLFQDLSMSTVSRQWRIYDQGDTLISQSKNLSYVFKKVGQYKVELEVFNHLNCTSIKEDSMYVFPEVIATISRQDTACLNNRLDFMGNGESNGRLNYATWELMMNGTRVAHDTGFSGNAALNMPGTYGLRYIIGNEFNCRDTAEELIYVEDPALFKSPQVKFVTIKNGGVDLYALPSTNARFSNATAVKNGQSLYQSTDRNFTEWLNLKFELNNGEQCYQIIEEDVCGFKKSSVLHCPVNLEATSTENFKIQLNWSAYKGWDDLIAYRVNRSKDGVSFDRIAELDSRTLQYTDSLLCRDSFYYFIEAVNQRGFVSNSNLVNQVPMYAPIKQILDVRDVKVVNNNSSILVNWDLSKDKRHASYALYKWDHQIEPMVVHLSDPFYLDSQVEPTSKTYKYEIRDMDICGEMGNPGNYGTSILLSGAYVNDRSILHWNDYLKWTEGVLKYQVLIEKDNGFEPVVDLEMVSTFNDPVIYPDIPGDYCYQILAISAPDARDTSISNYVCLIGPSSIYIPNAFTPNQDGKNDEFKPTMIFVRDKFDRNYQDYEFMVYNRWGEILFKTNELSEGWDGTFQNAPSQAGVYGYSVQIFGLDGKAYYKSGSVNLIR